MTTIQSQEVEQQITELMQSGQFDSVDGLLKEALCLLQFQRASDHYLVDRFWRDNREQIEQQLLQALDTEEVEVTDEEWRSAVDEAKELAKKLRNG